LQRDPDAGNRRLFLDTAKAFFPDAEGIKLLLWYYYDPCHKSSSRFSSEGLACFAWDKTEAIVSERRGKILHTLQLMRLTDLELRPEIDEVLGEIEKALKKG